MGLLAGQTHLRGKNIADLVKTFSGFVYAPMIDFYLKWLEELNTSETETEFGALASGLVNMVQNDKYGVVTALERRYGQPDADPPIETVFRQSFSDYFSTIEDRMQKIADVENEPKIMPTVIARWRSHSLETSKKA